MLSLQVCAAVNLYRTSKVEDLNTYVNEVL